MKGKNNGPALPRLDDCKGGQPVACAWDRASLLAWLQWCDPNGCFEDAQADAEGAPRLTLFQAQLHYASVAKGMDYDEGCPVLLRTVVDMLNGEFKWPSPPEGQA